MIGMSSSVSAARAPCTGRASPVGGSRGGPAASVRRVGFTRRTVFALPKKKTRTNAFTSTAVVVSAAAASVGGVQLYGSPGSRSPLVNWYLHEIDVDFESRPPSDSSNPHPFGKMGRESGGDITGCDPERGLKPVTGTKGFANGATACLSQHFQHWFANEYT